MIVNRGKIESIQDTVDRSINLNCHYHIVSSYGYAGIEWGSVQVENLIDYKEVPENERGAWEDSGMESEWLSEPWVVFRYTHNCIGQLDTNQQYMPAELFIRHTVSP